MSISIQKQRLVSLSLVLLTGLFAGIVRGQTPESPVNKGTPATETKTDEGSKTKAPAPVEEKITVTATRFERLIDLTPQSVTVMNAMEIHSRPMWNVQATLDDAPGISLQRVGGLDGQIVVRGLSSLDSRIVLFIDGDRFRGRNFLEYSLLDPNEIERIEIIRGPAAALYGSDAMNGVSLYAGLDLGRYQPWLKAYRITAGIDNLTDQSYVLPATRENTGFPRSPTNPLLEPGRSLSINITAGF